MITIFHLLEDENSSFIIGRSYLGQFAIPSGKFMNGDVDDTITVLSDLSSDCHRFIVHGVYPSLITGEV